MHRWMPAVACVQSLLAPVAMVQASGCAFALGFPPLLDLASDQVVVVETTKDRIRTRVTRSRRCAMAGDSGKV